MAYLHRHGAGYSNIITHARSSVSGLNDAASSLGLKLNLVTSDLSSEAATAGLVSYVEASGIELDSIVFFAAPRLRINRFHKLKWADFEHHLGVQSRAAFELLKSQLPGMAKRKSGKVVFVLSSVLDGKPPLCMSDYVFGKYAMLGLMKAAAAEYAGKRLCINAVSPSMMETRFLEDLPSTLVEMNAEAHPRGANATPTEIIPIIHFLLSDEAGFITGQNIIASGGA